MTFAMALYRIIYHRMLLLFFLSLISCGGVMAASVTSDSEDGGLRDYAHREWAGMLRDLYYPRWEAWIRSKRTEISGEKSKPVDFYDMDEKWVKSRNPYPSESEGDAVEVALQVMNRHIGR